MQEYTNLGELLLEWRRHVALTQEGAAEAAKVDAKTYERWERNRKPPLEANLHNLAEATGIAFPALVLLNSRVPVRYDIRLRRYALSDSDQDLASAATRTTAYFSTLAANTIHRATLSQQDAKAIAQYDHTIYPTDTPIQSSLYVEAARLLPDVNLIVRDPHGYHCGHMVSIPLRRDTNERMRANLIHEGELTPSDLRALHEAGGGALYLCSLYAWHNRIGEWLNRRFADFLRHWLADHPNNDFLISAYAVTADGDNICRRLKFDEVFKDFDDAKRSRTHVTPTFYEMSARAFSSLNLLHKVQNL